MNMKLLGAIFLLAFVAMADSSLLEMSQTLWNKVLAGGLTKIGALDPLRVPVVKVDQSEGNTSYRMILRSVEIIGLNSSTLESVHIARGRLKTNLSEHEAGYVSYSDQKELDTIRYRFHTVVKEPKGEESQNLEVKSLPDLNDGRRYDSSVKGGSNYQSSSRYQANQQRPQEQKQNYESSRYQSNQGGPQGQRQNYESSSGYRGNQQGSQSQKQNQGNQQGLQGQRQNYESSGYQSNQQGSQGPKQNYEPSRYQGNQQGSQGQRQNYESSSRYQDNQQGSSGQRQNYESSSRYQGQQQGSQGQRQNYESSSGYQGNQQSTQGQRQNYESSSGYQGNQQMPQDQRQNYESSSRYHNNQQKPQEQRRGELPSRYEDNQQRSQGQNYESSRNQPRNPQGSQGEFKLQYQIPNGQEQAYYTSSRTEQPNLRFSVGTRDGPGGVRVVYAERQRYPEGSSEIRNRQSTTDRTGTPECVGPCVYGKQQRYSGVRDNQRNENQKNRQNEDIGVAASMNFESRRAYVDASGNLGRNQEGSMRYNERYGEGDNQKKYQQYTKGPSARLENQPGYVDIVYADEKDHKMRHFGNLRVEPGKDKSVYSLGDVLRDLRDHRKFIIHNFTDGEALTKKNDAVKLAAESKRIKDLVRYAKDFQEKQGFYEQGMELIYHYGNDNSSDIDAKRTKRAHIEKEENDDDIMHVIMQIRVPMLRVHAGYVLMGKVDEQVLRGNGLLSGNFTDLIGDFTLELKKVGDDTMIVRAARARLSTKDKKIVLQGMDEEGPVKEILTHGLMAAEAVAAMLADDLATKALSEKTADSIIYKMYKNLPVEN